ncbi:putative membrane protein [Pedobacter sp. UYEF25]
MKKRHILHLVIGISAAVLALVAIYYIYLNPKNLISAGIVATASGVVAISQYLIIKGGRKV